MKMKMKQVENWRLSAWGLAHMVVMVEVLITMPNQVTSQVSQSTGLNNTLMRYYCSQYKPRNEMYFLSNLNTTLSSLRRQLTTNGHATARTLINGEPVWGLAWCRGYLSIPDCLSCFDYALNQLKECESFNGAVAMYNECFVRYETNNFYTEANNRADVVLCDNVTLPDEPTEFRKAAEELLLDLQTAAPRTSNFYALSTRQLADGSATVYAIAQCNLNVSQSVCLECLKLRSISLYACLHTISGRSMDNGCFMRYSRTPFFEQNQTTDISSLLWDGDSNKKRSIIGVVVGGVSFLLLAIAFFLWYRRFKKIGRGYEDKSIRPTQFLQSPASYSYNDLKVATDNFSDENKLGAGIFGEVHKGAFKNRDVAAIKKIRMPSSRGKRTHLSDELKIISNVHHRHLVRLLGYCIKGPHLFLVHEYMENQSLDHFLFDDKARTLNWRQRFQIIFGTARGLAYLHEQYHVTIIHRDIKTRNILLDNEFQPKIADFGLIRLLPEDKTHLSTESAGFLSGSGYVAPEYAIHGHLSEKVDTYSFGIVVLEIISGKRYNDVNSVALNLLDHAWNLYENDTHLNLVDDKIEPSEYSVGDAKKIIEIALMCTQSPVSARLSMSEVVTLLSDMSLEDKPPAWSSILDDEVKIQVSTMESSATDVTDSTVQLSCQLSGR